MVCECSPTPAPLGGWATLVSSLRKVQGRWREATAPTQPSNLPASFRKRWTVSTLPAKRREKVEGRQEGRKEKIYSCGPIYLGLLEKCL